jgi:hypothetical protein
VYPSISQELLITMTPEQIIAKDPRLYLPTSGDLLITNVAKGVAEVLGTTKTILAKDSKTFGQEIAKYIDSKDQKRGKKDKKDKDKDKDKNKSDNVSKGMTLMEKVRTAAGQAPKKGSETKDKDEPAFWPLIKQVNVRCRAHALSTGAILVDLPGQHNSLISCESFSSLLFRCC